MMNPSEAVAFELEEFRFVFSLAVHAGHLSIPASERMFGPLEHEPDGPSLRAANIPINRAGAAVLDHYEGGGVQYHSFMCRFFAFMDLVSSGALDAWMPESTESPGAREIHPAVIDVAARIPLTRKGKFPKRFVKEVKRLARREYSDKPNAMQASDEA